ncbi:MAG TPA: M64 family metallopeptidase [Chitinophagales bacterium]|nr:M64 family metallopeptidase [Chitinophagales bacterium]
MKKLLLLIFVQLTIWSTVHAQKFDVDTLQFNGIINKYINIVIMGDGYTSTEQDKFVLDAQNLSTYLFTQEPWSNYKNYFNIFVIRVVSAESGARHPNTASDCNSANPKVPISKPNTYFGSSFDSYGIHRLIVPSNVTNIVKVLSANFPKYDQVLILANSPYYGGSGGNYSTTTLDKYSPEIVAHEMGHSFANLADEYYAGASYTSERPNMTRQKNPSLVKWKNWVGHNEIGVYQYCCGGNSAQWYKPFTRCKMEYLNNPYCEVCKEAIVEKIHTLAKPIISYTPISSDINTSDQWIDFNLTELIKPIPNTLNIQWQLDGVDVLYNKDSFQLDQNTLTNPAHTVTVIVEDTTSFTRIDNHSTKHVSTITWNIYKTITGTQLNSFQNNIIYSIYPNPTNDILNISVELEHKENLSIQIYTIDGKLLQDLGNESSVDKNHTKTLSIGHLNNGTYALVFNVGSLRQTQLFVKQ